MAEPPKKKRKLPSLDEDFSPPLRPVLPSHQSRSRTVPHTPGQWASHIYLELVPSSALRKTLLAAHTLASSSPDVLSLLEPTEPLHLSLSRPLFLQTNQRAELRTALAGLVPMFSPFHARYATFAVLGNDESTRRFLGVEIGHGWAEMKELVTALDAKLSRLRLPPYYETPRFHSSISWSSRTTKSEEEEGVPFGEEKLARLEERFGAELRKEGLWVGDVCVKIGKEVVRYELGR